MLGVGKTVLCYVGMIKNVISGLGITVDQLLCHFIVKQQLVMGTSGGGILMLYLD